MNPPLPFRSPFLSAKPVRRSASIPPPPAPHTMDASSLIPWSRLISAVWDAGAEWALTGILPDGMSSHQFWARATRAASRKGGKVGVAVRGGEFWVWSIRKPEVKVSAGADGLPLVKKRRRGWVGELVLRLRSGEPVKVGWEMNATEVRRVRRGFSNNAGEGMRLHFGIGDGKTVVQWVGE